MGGEQIADLDQQLCAKMKRLLTHEVCTRKCLWCVSSLFGGVVNLCILGYAVSMHALLMEMCRNLMEGEVQASGSTVECGGFMNNLLNDGNFVEESSGLLSYPEHKWSRRC